ncbi:MAG: hypothetical protein ABI597_10865 [Gammaproteobacteria bacterium]
MPLFLSDEQYIDLIVKANHITQTNLVTLITKEELITVLVKPYQINGTFPTLLHFIASHDNGDLFNTVLNSLVLYQKKEKENKEDKEDKTKNDKSSSIAQPKMLDTIINLKTSQGETLLDLFANREYFYYWDKLSSLVSRAEFCIAFRSRDPNNNFTARVAASSGLKHFLKAHKEIFDEMILQIENIQDLLLVIKMTINFKGNNVKNFELLMKHLPKPVFDKMLLCQPEDEITFLTMVLERRGPEFFDLIAERIAYSDLLRTLRHCTPYNPSTTLLFLSAINNKTFNYLIKKLDRKDLNDIFAHQVSLGQASMDEISKSLNRDTVLYLEKTLYPHLLATLDLEEIWSRHLTDPQEKTDFVQRYRPMRQFLNQAEQSITDTPKEFVAYFQELLANQIDDYAYWEKTLKTFITISLNQNNFAVVDALYVLLARINFKQYLANNNFEIYYLDRMYDALFAIRDSSHLNASDNLFVGNSLTALGFPSEPAIAAGIAVDLLIEDKPFVRSQKMYPEVYRAGLVCLQAAVKFANAVMKDILQVPFSIFTSDDRLEEKSATSTLTEKIKALDNHIEYLETLGWGKFCDFLQLARANPDSQLNTALIQELLKKKLVFEMASLTGKTRIGEEIVSLLKQGLTQKSSTSTLFASMPHKPKDELEQMFNIIRKINLELVAQMQGRVLDNDTHLVGMTPTPGF